MTLLRCSNLLRQVTSNPSIRRATAPHLSNGVESFGIHRPAPLRQLKTKSSQHAWIVKTTIPQRAEVAPFHSSSRALILPPPPQRIDGTVNDPIPLPPPSPTHGSYHWTFERLMAAGLVPLTIAPFAVGSVNPILDATICAAFLIHSHIGFQSIIIDYIPEKRLPRTRALSWWLLRIATVWVGVGLYEFETSDVGLTEAVKRIWKA